jgi:hypothetical protein
MFSAASTLVRTSVVKPQRNSCLKRVCPASASQGAGLPYPQRTRDWITPGPAKLDYDVAGLAADK